MARTGKKPTTHLTSPWSPLMPCRSGVAFGSQSHISETQRRKSSLTSRSSGREWVEPGAPLHPHALSWSASLRRGCWAAAPFSLFPPHSKNLNNSQSELVSFKLSVEAKASVSLNGCVCGGSGALLGDQCWGRPQGFLNPFPLQCVQARGGGLPAD